jgi:RING-box protein 1
MVEAKFEVKKWSAVAMWTYDFWQFRNCSICRSQINELCIECQANQTSARPEDCPEATGVCYHSFHPHCNTHWLEIRQVCPLDGQDWEFMVRVIEHLKLCSFEGLRRVGPMTY